jgi:alkanesulfonate monooxygenase SsuD/methylene tetrahydromethanopterin reductase-like flavin-dependent oxidoreductase (luciferase family)
MMLPMSVLDGPGRMPTWPEVRAVAQHAEAVGLDSAWVCDHLLSESPGRPVEGIAEGWTLLAALAASTARLTLGTLVTPTVFRHPALLAKMAAGVDGICGGSCSGSEPDSRVRSTACTASPPATAGRGSKRNCRSSSGC